MKLQTCLLNAGQLFHCSFIRMAKLGVIAAVQPQNVPLDARWARQKLPDALQECMYPYRTLLENGVTCAGSSDSPAYIPNSLIGIHDVILQPDCLQGQSSYSEDHGCFQPNERVTFTQAIDMYTSEAAKTDFAEEFLGQLEIGYFANFVVLDTPQKRGKIVDISQNPEALLKTVVSQTWARGRKIYDVTISGQ